jgi:ankyrin repeat protein
MLKRSGNEIEGGATRRLFLFGIVAGVAAGVVMGSHESQANEAAERRLLAAAAAGDRAGVAAALKAGARIEARDRQNNTALLLAVIGNHVDLGRDLIAAGADINAQADNQDTPWLLAGADGRTALLRAMLATDRVDYTRRNRYGGNALIPAAHHGHVEAVRFLLAESKIDIDQINNLGWTALLEAVILGDGGEAHTEIVRLLVANGANVNLADREGVSPLAHARRRGYEAISGILARSGAR